MFFIAVEMTFYYRVLPLSRKMAVNEALPSWESHVIGTVFSRDVEVENSGASMSYPQFTCEPVLKCKMNRGRNRG